PNGTLVMYSAALSSVISDNGSDRSLFVQQLLKEMRVPELMTEETLNRPRIGVTRASRSEQVPWISSSLAEDFSFIPGTVARPSAPVIAALPQPAAPASGSSSPLPGQQASPAQVAVAPADNRPAVKNESSPALALADDPTIKSLTAKLADNPDDQNALYRRGQVYASKGAYDLAIKDFDGSLRLNAKDVEALKNRCWVRSVVGELKGALKDCNDALRLRPNFADALESRGLVRRVGRGMVLVRASIPSGREADGRQRAGDRDEVHQRLLLRHGARHRLHRAAPRSGGGRRSGGIQGRRRAGARRRDGHRQSGAGPADAAAGTRRRKDIASSELAAGAGRRPHHRGQDHCGCAGLAAG